MTPSLVSKSFSDKFARSLLGLLILTPLWVYPNENTDDKQQQLAKLRQHMSSLKIELETVRTARDRQRQALQQTESKITQLDRAISQTKSQFAANKVELGGLQKRQSKTLVKIKQQRIQFNRLVRATYMMGRQDYAKLLLSQRDPSGISRVMEYYKYISQMRLDRIRGFTSALTELERLENQIKQNSVELTILTEVQKRNRQALLAHYGDREIMIRNLATEISTKSKQIETLREDERRLLKLVEQLKKFSVSQQFYANIVKPFSSMRGKLNLPLDANIVAYFGEIQQPSGIRWQGLLMAAPQDKPIKAIFNGRVIFADRFRGFGLLLILDHGDGYMSLYSHNNQLFKQLGDWANTGELIASVGISGGLAKPGLYFEIRKNGVPDDPLLWSKQ